MSALKPIVRSARPHVIDASGRTLGRVATEAARFLQGKNRPGYAAHRDSGEVVHIRNIKKARFSGKKFDQKKFFHYSGYPGGLITRSLVNEWEKRPEEVLRHMVYGMLPTNTLRKKWIKRLHITV